MLPDARQIASERATLEIEDLVREEVARRLAAFFRVHRRCLGVLQAYWQNVLHLPPTHPYRQAARMLESYLEEQDAQS